MSNANHDATLAIAGELAEEVRELAKSASDLTPLARASPEALEAYARGVDAGQATLASRLLGSGEEARSGFLGRVHVSWTCPACGLRAEGALDFANLLALRWLGEAWSAHKEACAAKVVAPTTGAWQRAACEETPQ